VRRDNMKKRENLKTYGIWGLGIIGALLILFLGKLTFGNYIGDFITALNSVLIPAAISIFGFYIVYPIYLGIKKVIRSSGLSAVLTIIIFFLILAGLLFLIGFLLTDQIGIIVVRIEENWPFIVERAESLLFLIPDAIMQEITNPVNGAIEANRVFTYITETLGLSIFGLVGETVNILGSLFHWVVIITLTPVFLFFFLVDGPKIFWFISTYIPERLFRKDITNVALIANESTGKYIRGKMISIMALALMFFIIFSVVFFVFGKIPFFTVLLYALLFAIIIASLDLVPFIGPLIGLVLPLGFILILSETNTEFLVYGSVLIVLNLLAQEAQKTLVEPLIMSKEINIHPIAILMGLLFFGALFGFVGFILATPLISTIHATRNYFVKQYEEENKKEEIVVEETVQQS
jgi:putative permease